MYKGGLFTNYEQLCAERNRLEEQIKGIQSQLSQLPSGDIIAARNGTGYKWYHTQPHSQTYIPKSQRTFAEQLATKKYLSLLYQDIYHEKQALDSYLIQHSENTHNAEQLLHNPAYHELLSSYFKPDSDKLAEWSSLPYERNPKFPEQLNHTSPSGNVLRSKSEMIIDMLLFLNKIPFRYECSLQLGSSTIYPDFTIRHPRTGETFYWEHFGLMDNPNYCHNMHTKLQLYTSHGIIPTINLITTYETSQKPLSSSTIEVIINQYFM